MLLKGFPACPRRQRRPTLFPCVADQPEPRVAERPFGGRREQHCLPPLILIDIERTLIQPFSRRGTKAEVPALVNLCGSACSSQRRQQYRTFQKISATHFRGFLSWRNLSKAWNEILR